MYMTNEKLMKEAQEVINLHAPIILKELGLEDNDGILERIFVSDTKNDANNALITKEVRKTVRYGQVVRQEYVVGSAFIDINPLVSFYYEGKDGAVKSEPFVMRFFRKTIRQNILFTLAHELRHYWQYHSGEIFKNELMMNGIKALSYERQWCERDANQFGVEYLSKFYK